MQRTDAYRPSQGNNGEPNDNAQPASPPKPSKKRRVVEPYKLVTQNYLENPQDVDAFLQRLRQELEDAIKNNERVEIR